MNISIVAIGSRGDVQPMILLAMELIRREHRVSFFAPPDFQHQIENLGISCTCVGRDMTEWMIEETKKGYGKSHIFKMMTDYITEEVGQQFSVLRDAIPLDIDLLITNFFCWIRDSIAELHGVPNLFIHMFPHSIPTFEHPPSLGFPENLPNAVNRLIWKLIESDSGNRLTQTVNHMRSEVGLPRLKRANIMRGQHHIAAFDPELTKLPGDIPFASLKRDMPVETIIQVGAFTSNGNETLSKEINKFIDRGDEPIYFGFGSMTDNNRREFITQIVEVTQSLGQRGIICDGWTKTDHIELPDTFLRIDEAPHNKLFQKCKLIVHHGGAGTTASAVRSGQPQLIIPHLCDQYFWGRRVYELGLGAMPISRVKFSGKKLKKSLKCILRNDEVNINSKRLADQINARDYGLTDAVRFIENYFMPKKKI